MILDRLRAAARAARDGLARVGEQTSQVTFTLGGFTATIHAPQQVSVQPNATPATPPACSAPTSCGPTCIRCGSLGGRR